MGDKEWRNGCRTPTHYPGTDNRWLSVGAEGASWEIKRRAAGRMVSPPPPRISSHPGAGRGEGSRGARAGMGCAYSLKGGARRAAEGRWMGEVGRGARLYGVRVRSVKQPGRVWHRCLRPAALRSEPRAHTPARLRSTTRKPTSTGKPKARRWTVWSSRDFPCRSKCSSTG